MGFHPHAPAGLVWTELLAFYRLEPGGRHQPPTADEIAVVSVFQIGSGREERPRPPRSFGIGLECGVALIDLLSGDCDDYETRPPRIRRNGSSNRPAGEPIRLGAIKTFGLRGARRPAACLNDFRSCRMRPASHRSRASAPHGDLLGLDDPPNTAAPSGIGQRLHARDRSAQSCHTVVICISLVIQICRSMRAVTGSL